MGCPRFVSQQIYYSLQSRDAEYELIPAAVDQGLGVLVWSPLAGGLLSGKYRRDQRPDSGSRQLTDWNEPPVYDQDKLYDTVDVLVEDRRSSTACRPPGSRWPTCCDKPAVTSLVIGARTSQQLADNLAAADLELTTRTTAGGWTRSARRRCCTRTGIRPRRPAIGCPRPT